uniref:ribosomal protein S11 n=1 Tax=Anarthria humilis TaxID=198286 RepID=UPI001F14377E|nr:ribosomal protein S11 [Anarthria humilis]YP_010290335.1 ribosomal protein S11 [Anarthria humilis]YP_010290375.1 ribosomal protein S11 [Anarthria humilis]ULQ64081.1 ribosomal protein S11 [Anarthria humilis]ULQ64101.1 ribosomal protein S11 [Anarthria humilis]ULQ64141.1 ribosomal protein S11 [Anarthria humilis]
MKKARPKIGFRRGRFGFRRSRFGFRKNRRTRFRFRNKGRRLEKEGVIHIQASLNNTITSVTDVEGRVIYWACAGTSGFKGPKKATPYAAERATAEAIGAVVDLGMRRAAIMIRGGGKGRDGALRAIRKSRIRLILLRDVTRMSHNGCRPPKRRRV